MSGQPQHSPTLLVAPSKAEVPSVLCDAIVGLASDAISERNMFSIALSGGSLPKFLGRLPHAFAQKGIDPRWDSWHVFLADERCVPISSDDSNLKSIASNFLDVEGVGIPKNQIYGIDNTLTDKLAKEEQEGQEEAQQQQPQQPKAADATTEAIAVRYEENLRRVLPEPHTLDLAVLGFGPDGHTCSLFPGHHLLTLQGGGKFVASIVDSPKLPPRRITLTLEFLNDHTNHIIVCGAGASKYPIIEAVFDLGDENERKKESDNEADFCKTLLPKLVSPPPYPCSMVTPKQSLTWVVDADAMVGESK